MKILVADDNNDKVGRLLEVLSAAGLSGDDVHVAYTVHDARRELRDSDFDLLILDVLLPGRAGEMPRHAASVDLLTELVERSTLRKPKHVIGFTAYDEALRDAGPAFLSRTWTVVKFSFEADDWKAQIRECVTYIQKTTSQRPVRGYKTDLCIVTALLEPEFDAIMRLKWKWSVFEPLDDNTFVRRGAFTSGGIEYSVVAACAPRMGMVSAALLASKLIDYEKPRFLVMAGICAGIEDKTNFGDVILADPSWDWQSGKHFVKEEKRGFAIAPDPLGPASFVRARFDAMRPKQEIWAAIRSEWVGPPDTELKIKVAPMASGSSVLADSEIVDRIAEQNRNLTAIEMEAYGIVSAAAMASHPRPTAFVCKSVSDFANEIKDDKWRTYAAYTSAQAVRHFFEAHMCDIVGLAGTR